jgi:hypothetical protein
VDAAELLDDVDARPQREMVEVRQHHRGAGVLELGDRQALDRAEGADRHESRGLDHAVRGLEAAAAGQAMARHDLEAERHRRGWLGG